jgi:hypothetical protein
MPWESAYSYMFRGNKKNLAKEFEKQKHENHGDIETLRIACCLNNPSAQEFLKQMCGSEDLCTYLHRRNQERSLNADIWFYIAWGGNWEILGQAIKNGYCSTTETYSFGIKIIHYLAWSGNYSALLKYIEKFSISADVLNDKNNSIWHYLAWSGNYTALKNAIIANKFDPHLLKNNNREPIGFNLKLSTNYLGLLDAILNGWIDPNYRNKYNNTIISGVLLNKHVYKYMENDNMYQACVAWDNLAKSLASMDKNSFVQELEKVALPEVGLAFILYQLKNAANDLQEETLFESVKILLEKLVVRLASYQAQDYQDVVYDILQHWFIMNILTKGLSPEEIGEIILKCFSVGNPKSVNLINSLLTHLYSFEKEGFFVTLQKMLILASESPDKGSLPEATCEVLQNFYSFKSAAVDNAKTFDDFMVTLETSQQKLLQKTLGTKEMDSLVRNMKKFKL